MSLFRCAACGSPRVVTDIETEGYSLVKGAVGVALLGVGGAVAGINGKKKTVYKCPDCGVTLSYPMDFKLKTLIDIGVMSGGTCTELNLDGVNIAWSTLTSRYKNIESVSVTSVNHSVGKVTEEKSADTIYKENENRIKYEIAKREHKAEREAWEDLCLEHKDVVYALALEKIKAYGLELEKKESAELDSLNKEIADISSEIESVKVTISKLGLFAFKESKQLKAELASLQARKDELEEQLNEVSEKYQWLFYDIDNYDSDEPFDIRSATGDKTLELIEEARKQTSYPKMPDIPKHLLIYNAQGEAAKQGDAAYYLSLDIVNYLIKTGSATLDQIHKGCPSMEDLTEKHILTLVEHLCAIGELTATVGGEKAYSIRYNEWNAEKRRNRPQYMAEHKELLDVMRSLGGTATISDICERIPEYKDQNMKVSTILRHLIEVSVVERAEVNGKVYFTVLL